MPFRAIIIGGGPAGLAMAHALHLAKTDFVLLERRSNLVNHAGATTTLNPDGTRLIHQLGILEAAIEEAVILKTWVDIGADGKEIHSTDIFKYVEENHGYPTLMFSRPGLLKVLSSTLPEAAAKKCRVNAKVKTISIADDAGEGVSVELEDGTTETGDILIAADGVHSKVRRLLVEADPAALGGHTSFTEHEYQILYGRSRTPPQLIGQEGKFFVRHGEGWFIQFTQSKDDLAWVLYQREDLEKAVPTADPITRTEEEITAFVNPLRHEVLLAETGYTIGNLWEDRTMGFLDYMEEGVAEKWHHKRVVFIGDATAKINPSQAQGGNLAIESAVSLANELHAILAQNPSPPQLEIVKAFTRYQASRWIKSAYLIDRSRGFVSFECWPTPFIRRAWYVVNWVILQRQAWAADFLVSSIKKYSTQLDYVPFEEEKDGDRPSPRIKWVDVRKQQTAEDLGYFESLGAIWSLVLGGRFGQ